MTKQANKQAAASPHASQGLPLAPSDVLPPIDLPDPKPAGLFTGGRRHAAHDPSAPSLSEEIKARLSDLWSRGEQIHPYLPHALAAGIPMLGLGGMLLSRRRKKRRREDEDKEGAMAKTAAIRDAADVVLDQLAGEYDGQKRAAVRLIQAELARGRSLSGAIKKATGCTTKQARAQVKRLAPAIGECLRSAALVERS